MSNARNLSKFTPSSSGLVETADIADDAVTTAKVNPSQTDITSVGALNAGSITSGFGAIDVGSSDITTTGTGVFGAMNGTTIANISLNSQASYLGNYRAIGWGGTANGTTHIYSQYNTVDDLTLHAGTGKGIIFETGGSTADRMTLDSNGDLTIGSGNLIIGTSGKGIDFSATGDGAATDTSELFADYEEGDWTPAPYGATTSGSVTSGTMTGKYTRVGRVVHLECRATAIVLSSAGGSYYIDGLPYTVGGTGYNSGSVSLYKVNFDDNTYVEVNASGTTIYFLVSRDNTTWTTLDQSVFGSQHYYHFSITYTI